MRITICENKIELGREAAAMGRHHIKSAIQRQGRANVAFVTGTSQLEMLKALRAMEIDWSKVNIFLLDEFIGLPDGHKASSETFLKENFISFLPEVGSFHPISRRENAEQTIEEMNKLMADYPLDVSFICIGENGHLAFNDPPADLDATDPYIIVDLERRSRRQQVGEGWFQNIDEVPVAMCVFDDIAPAAPCATLRRTECSLFLDRQSSRLILSDGRQK